MDIMSRMIYFSKYHLYISGYKLYNIIRKSCDLTFFIYFLFKKVKFNY